MNLHLQITSGRGPEECGWVVARLIPRFFHDAAQKGLTITEIEVIPGIPSTIRSAVFEITGESAETFARSWTGTILWIGKSPFDPHHKRKNWYVSIERIALDTGENPNLKDIEIQTMRASGPGGQHVNKTSSAVRAIHRPTGLAAVAQDGRSQHQNRKLAFARLQLLLNKRNALKEQGKKKHKWDLHNQLERGNPVRTFEGADFQERLR